MNPVNKCILQIEDEEGDIFLFKFACEQAGIDTPLQTVTDGQMAIDYLSGVGPYADRHKHPLPFLVLLDLKLPKVSGLEALAWIRQQPGLKHLVVIVFSSSAQPRDVERAYELGANSFVQKPSSLEETIELLQLLKSWWLRYNHFAHGRDKNQERTPASVATPPPHC